MTWLSNYIQHNLNKKIFKTENKNFFEIQNSEEYYNIFTFAVSF